MKIDQKTDLEICLLLILGYIISLILAVFFSGSVGIISMILMAVFYIHDLILRLKK